MAQKIRLEDDTLPPVSIFGIICDLPDHRLCYILNNELSLRLCRSQKDKEFYFKKNRLQYSEYVYHQEVSMMTWRLTSNANATFFPAEQKEAERASIALVNDLRSMNYFLWYEDESREDLNNFILQKLRSNKYIRAVRIIDQTSSKNIENLLLEY